MFANIDHTPNIPNILGVADRNAFVENTKQALYWQHAKLEDLTRLSFGAVSEVSTSRKTIEVSRFHVWQDLTPADSTSDPMYATLTIEIPETVLVNLNKPEGTIKIEDQDGETLVEARLLINHSHYGLGLIPKGSRQVQFAMAPTPVRGSLSNIRTVRGTAKIRIGDRMECIQLPETKIIFTR